MPDNRRLFSKKFRAMGTGVSVDFILGVGKEEEAEQIFSGIKGIFAEEEKRFSRFNSESELSILNRHPGEEREVSEEFAEVLEMARKYSQRFPGIFDPRIIEVLEKSGYDRDFRKFDPGEKSVAEEKPERAAGLFSDSVKIDKNKKKKTRVLIKERIDLSGIVKGWCIDRAAEFVKRQGWSDFVIEAGGDMYLSGRNVNDDVWNISVEGLEGKNLKISEAGIATSGISRRRWSRDGKKFHHLVDPRYPGEFRHDLKSVTAIARNTTEADVLAKVLFLEGRESGLARAGKEKIPCLFLDYKNHAYVSTAFKDFMA